MARIPNYNTRQQRLIQTPQEPERPVSFRIGWLLVPLSLLGMAYILHHIQPVISWDDVMGFLNVKNRERYTMLAILCLVSVSIVAAAKIIGRK